MILMASILGVVTLRIMYVVYDKHNIELHMLKCTVCTFQTYRASRAKSDP